VVNHKRGSSCRTRETSLVDRADIGERVLVELVWYDGPRAGIAYVDGRPHYFHSDDWLQDSDAAEYKTWPIGPDALAAEIESCRIFVAWDDLHRSGLATPDTHPGNGGVDPRFDALEQRLVPCRVPPDDAARRRAEWIPPPKRPDRPYTPDGPAYRVRWGNAST
jgi:hypothetical protein